MPLTSACESRVFDRCRPPGFVLFDGFRPWRSTVSANVDQPLGRVGPAIEEHVFDVAEQFLVNLFVDGELAGVDDAHVEAGLDRVVQKGRIHRLADRLVAAERERNVAHAARGLRAGAFSLDLPQRPR